MNEYSHRYLYEMKMEQEALQQKTEVADKVLSEELRIFKSKLATDYQHLVNSFQIEQKNASARLNEKWQIYMLKMEEFKD